MVQFYQGTRLEVIIMRILLVEDDLPLNNIISKRLCEEGHIVDSCFNGADGLDYAQGIDYDCVVLDLMLPKINGLDLLRTIRSQGKTAKVLILTARDAVEDRVKGLDAGADDYMNKPFSFDELMARLRALTRRQGVIKSSVLSLADLTMDTINRSVTRGGKLIPLTSKEYALLEYMLRNNGAILTRSQIIDHVWNFDFNYDSNVVDVYVKYLRGKIDNDFEPKLIHTIRGFGYVMRCEDA